MNEPRLFRDLDFVEDGVPVVRGLQEFHPEIRPVLFLSNLKDFKSIFRYKAREFLLKCCVYYDKQSKLSSRIHQRKVRRL